MSINKILLVAGLASSLILGILFIYEAFNSDSSSIDDKLEKVNETIYNKLSDNKKNKFVLEFGGNTIPVNVEAMHQILYKEGDVALQYGDYQFNYKVKDGVVKLSGEDDKKDFKDFFEKYFSKNINLEEKYSETDSSSKAELIKTLTQINLLNDNPLRTEYPNDIIVMDIIATSARSYLDKYKNVIIKNKKLESVSGNSEGLTAFIEKSELESIFPKGGAILSYFSYFLTVVILSIFIYLPIWGINAKPRKKPKPVTNSTRGSENQQKSYSKLIEAFKNTDVSNLTSTQVEEKLKTLFKNVLVTKQKAERDILARKYRTLFDRYKAALALESPKGKDKTQLKAIETIIRSELQSGRETVDSRTDLPIHAISDLKQHIDFLIKDSKAPHVNLTPIKSQIQTEGKKIEKKIESEIKNKVSERIARLAQATQNNQSKIKNIEGKIGELTSQQAKENKRLKTVENDYNQVVKALGGELNNIIPTLKNLFDKQSKIKKNLEALANGQKIQKILTETGDTNERIEKILAFADEQAKNQPFVKRWNTVVQAGTRYQTIREMVVKDKKTTFIKTLSSGQTNINQGDFYKGIQTIISLFISPQKETKLNTTLQNSQFIEAETVKIKPKLLSTLKDTKGFLNTTDVLLEFITQLANKNEWNFQDAEQYKKTLMRIIMSNSVYTEIARKTQKLNTQLGQLKPKQQHRAMSILKNNGLNQEAINEIVEKIIYKFEKMPAITQKYGSIKDMSKDRFNHLVTIYDYSIKQRISNLDSIAFLENIYQKHNQLFRILSKAKPSAAQKSLFFEKLFNFSLNMYSYMMMEREQETAWKQKEQINVEMMRDTDVSLANFEEGMHYDIFKIGKTGESVIAIRNIAKALGVKTFGGALVRGTYIPDHFLSNT